MGKKRVARLLSGVLVGISLLGTVLMAQARAVGPVGYGFEFYPSDSTRTQYTDTYYRSQTGAYGTVTGKSIGGDVGSIKLTIYHCNMQTLSPDAAMTSSAYGKLGTTNLYYGSQWVNTGGFTRLQGKAGYVEAMMSGYWNP